MEKKIVAVKFVSRDNDGFLCEKEYTYFTRMELEKLDFVIIVVNDIPKIAQVVLFENELSKAQKGMASKWIAQKVDLTEYNAIVERETKIAAIEDALDAALIKANRYEMFKKMASSNPEIKQLLEELQTLNTDITLIS